MAFIGRERELAVVGAALQRSSQRALTRVAISGPLGIGITRLLDELETRIAGAGRFNLCLYRHFRAWEAMQRKDLMSALQEAKAALRTAIEVGCPLFEVLCRLALAEILADCGDERKCVANLQTLRVIVEGIDNRHLEFTCLTGFAQIALAHGRRRTGLAALRRGLELGREYGYFHFLGWQPAAVARVLVQALEAGIERDYAKSLIKRRNLVPEKPPLAVEGWPWTYRVQTFGGFRLLRHDEPLNAGQGKAKKRPLELLKLLIAYGGEQVSESKVTDALWPRIDGDSAHRSFTSTLHRLRKLLGADSAVTLHEGRLSLDRRHFHGCPAADRSTPSANVMLRSLAGGRAICAPPPWGLRGWNGRSCPHPRRRTAARRFRTHG